MQPTSYKRITAYIIDILLISIISSLLTYNIYNGKQYSNLSKEYVNTINEYSKKEITQEEFSNKSYELVYDMNKETIVVSIVSLVLTTVYFVVLPYFMNGQTLGKKLMKLQIVSGNEKKLTMNNYLIRALFINSILLNTLGVLFILFLPKNAYFKANDVITYIFGAFFIVSISMILFRQDKRGLHDILSGTIVVSTDKKVNVVTTKEKEEKDNKIEEIKDAEIIGKNAKIQ